MFNNAKGNLEDAKKYSYVVIAQKEDNTEIKQNSGYATHEEAELAMNDCINECVSAGYEIRNSHVNFYYG